MAVSCPGSPVPDADRRALGARMFEEVNRFPAPTALDPLTEAAVEGAASKLGSDEAERMTS